MPGSEGPILPVLKPADWVGREAAVSRPLLPDQESEYMPILAFGYDRPHSFEFLSAEKIPAAEASDQFELIEHAALRNLRSRPVNWDRQSADVGGGRTLTIALCGDDYLAAERILDTDTMMKAHELLQAEMLAVGVPRRGMLIAANAAQPKEILTNYLMMISVQYFRAESAPISPLPIVVREGELVGVIKGMEEAGKQAVEEELKADTDIQCRAMVVKDEETDEQRAVILAGGEDIELVARAVQNTIFQIVDSLKEEPAFGGHIEVVLIPDLTPFSENMEQELDSLQRHLNGVVRELQLSTQQGQPIQVRLRHGED